MGNQEYYEMKLEIITAIGEDQIKTPHHIPVDVYIQEAQTLYSWARLDKEALTAAGLSWELVEDLPIRIGTLIEAESSWYVQRKNGVEATETWAREAPLAYDLKKRLANDFRYAFRKRPDLLSALRQTVKGQGHASMLQALNDLSLLGKRNTELLEAIHFDMALLDRAAQTSDKLSEVLAEATAYRRASNETKKIRDQAYTHLKEAVDEIRECGQFVFRKNEERFRGYRSDYLRGKNQKSKRRRQAPKPTAPEVPGKAE